MTFSSNPMLVENKLLGRDFLSLTSFEKDEILYLLDLAAVLKAEHKLGIQHNLLNGKTLGMIFEKSSTRTRVSFEVGMYQLGGNALFLSMKDIQMGRGEPISDTAQVLSGYVDGMMIRTFSHHIVEEFAKYASVPVINGLTDMYHPCQVLADLLTIRECKGNLKGVKIAYIGDGNNMAHSLLIGCVKIGAHIAIASPKGYEPKKDVVQMATEIAASENGLVTITNDPFEAALHADVIYTDVWASMGQELEQDKRAIVFQNFQVDGALMAYAKQDAVFMHCLPAHRGEEVSSSVIDGKQSVIYHQSVNRLHAQKALLIALLSENKAKNFDL